MDGKNLVAMVKHNPHGEIYWFKVPENLQSMVLNNRCVLCDTRRGVKPGFIVGQCFDQEDVRTLMVKSGATFPLREIVGVERMVGIYDINIPKWMSQPKDEKIAKRFLEFYHTGRFQTPVLIDKSKMLLIDGYSAYLCAKKMGATGIDAVVVPTSDAPRTGT
jgi:hypothetical protein